MGGIIALTFFLFFYLHFKKIRHHETTTYFYGVGGVYDGVTHESGGGM
ncbi:hypothetical protein TuanDB_42260 [Bacillus anthracis]|uniref:Uncharacterized protein n=1 Tax=Bacillus anthracis TaxID=1392 RepID=A0A640LMU6_BACAN|nr:hypothetical protein TuanDB_42260 [Bacillus anthracis]